MGYAFLRAWQYWLARYQTPHHRLQSGIDAVLHVLDWVPVRLAGVVYALIGHGEKALPAWFALLGDFHTSQYQVLTRLVQFSWRVNRMSIRWRRRRQRFQWRRKPRSWSW